STEVWAKHLKRFGPATKTTERRSLASKPFDRELRRDARASLQYPSVHFNREQIACVGTGFAQAIATLSLQVVACAVMPDHVHLVIHRHRTTIEEIVGFLKRAATRELTRSNLHPLTAHTTARGRVPSPWVD